MINGLKSRKEAVIELLWDHLKRDPEHADRRCTGWGTKTQVGLVASIERIFVEYPYWWSHEVIVMWGEADESEGPREAKVYTFGTVDEAAAFRSGVIQSHPENRGYLFGMRDEEGNIPEDPEWHHLND